VATPLTAQYVVTVAKMAVVSGGSRVFLMNFSPGPKEPRAQKVAWWLNSIMSVVKQLSSSGGGCGTEE
jgi:hypothetical protein